MCVRDCFFGPIVDNYATVRDGLPSVGGDFASIDEENGIGAIHDTRGIFGQAAELLGV